MTTRSNPNDAAQRAYMGVSRATLVKADDSQKMQELTVRARFGEQWTNVEHWHSYGVTHVPLPPDKDGEAEILIAYLGGSPDHPIAIGTADRRHRPKDLKPGDIAHHDHRGQTTVFSDTGITHTSPLKITHNTTDRDGKVMSSVVQEPSGKVTISNHGGSTVVLDGPNMTFKPGSGGKITHDGDVAVKGGLQASKTIAGQAVTSGGLNVRTV